MTYEEALEQVAKENDCSPSQLVVCSEEGAKLCDCWPCTRVQELMATTDRGVPVTNDENMVVGFVAPREKSAPISNRKRVLVLPTDAAERNKYPMFDGLLGYFPNALAAIANLSFIANEQHNPGEPLHWAVGKSTDHANKIVKHLLDHGHMDTDGTRHSTKLGWRALALLEEELVAAGAPRGRNVY